MLGAHHSCRDLIHFPVAPLAIYLASFSASDSPSAASPPLLHLLRAYLLILPSVSIRADCCHFGAVCPCISFLFSRSLSSTQFPLSLSIHLSPGEQTGATALTPAGVGKVVLSGGFTPLKHFGCQLLVTEDAAVLLSVRKIKNPQSLMYCTHGMKTTPSCVFIFIKKTHFFHFCVCV